MSGLYSDLWGKNNGCANQLICEIPEILSQPPKGYQSAPEPAIAMLCPLSHEMWGCSENCGAGRLPTSPLRGLLGNSV